MGGIIPMNEVFGINSGRRKKEEEAEKTQKKKKKNDRYGIQYKIYRVI